MMVLTSHNRYFDDVRSSAIFDFLVTKYINLVFDSMNKRNIILVVVALVLLIISCISLFFMVGRSIVTQSISTGSVAGVTQGSNIQLETSR